MIKAVKKLNKLWSRKKRKKKIHQYQHPYYHFHFPPPPLPPPPPPQPCHLCCSYTSAAQPSAPPLPPWLEPEQTHEANLENGLQQQYSFHDHLVYPSQGSQEIVVETNPISPTLPANASSTYSYQQYMEPNPVYGVPVVKVPRREKPDGFFDCVVKFGANLIRCFCPCFRIREANEIIVA